MEYNNITLTDLSIFRNSPTGYVIPWKGNSCFYCSAGRMKLEVNNVKFELSAGSIFIHSPFSNVVIEIVTSDIDGVICGADYKFILSVTKSLSITENILFFAENPIVKLSEEQRLTMENLIGMISELKSGADIPLRPQLAMTLETALFYLILSDYFETNPISRNYQDRNNIFLWNFQKDLDRHIRQHRDVKFYAALQNLSSRYFSSVIHQLSGKTASKWITDTVISEAKNLILHSHKSFKEIAFLLHFDNPSAFARYFKKYAGLSPSEFRNKGMDKHLTEK